MAYLEVIGSDNIHFDEKDFEATRAAYNDPNVLILNLPDRSIKKTVVAQVVSEPETVIIPPSKPDNTIDELRKMI